MRSITRIWFEVKARYEQTQDDGTEKKVIETFVVDATDFAKAYNKACEYVGENLTGGEFEIVHEKIAPYSEVLLSDKAGDDRYYRVKVILITLDEKTNKEKKTPVYHLVQAGSVEKARKYTSDEYSESMMDFHIEAVVETKISDVWHKM